MRSHEVGDEERLVLLEDHAILNSLLLIQVVPGAVGAFLAVAAILQHPVAVFVLDGALHLAYQLVVNADVAVGRTPNHELLLLVLADTSKVSLNFYLHDVGVLKVVWWEDLQLKLVGDVLTVNGRSLALLRVLLVVDQVGDHVALADVDQETVSDDDGTVQLGKGAIALAQVLDLVLAVDRVELDEELSSLVVVGRATHHGVHARLLVLARVRVVRVISWDDEVVHLLAEHLLARGVLDEATGGTGTILRVIVIRTGLGAILNTKVGVAVVFASARAV